MGYGFGKISDLDTRTSRGNDVKKTREDDIQ